MTRTFIRFKHSGNLGDVIYALPSIKKYCELHKVSAELLLIVGAPMWLPSNLSHPSGNVMLTAHGVDMLKPPCAAVAVAVVHGDDDLRENLFRQPP